MTKPVTNRDPQRPPDLQSAAWSNDLWSAVQKRDPRYDPIFVYGVRSTGIYCRPSCPSRRPRAEQVAFFERPEAAEEAGFRPCLRCQPRRNGGKRPQDQLVERVCRLIDANLDRPVTLDRLARATGSSAFHLQRTFKKALGITPRQYAEARRLIRLKLRLRKGDNVTTATYEAGFGSGSRVYERSARHLGMTPGTYRRGGVGARIRYAVVNSPLGRVLLAATDAGVCAVRFGENDAEMLRELEREYPRARIERDANSLAAWARQVTAHIAGYSRSLELPLDIRATAFQRKVWEALRNIPLGETRSYGELARAIGDPKALRAVARACATNPVAVVIPCHRAVAKDGKLAGYRWGTERKRALLESESAARQPQRAAAQ
jgi:AraC family transcriptional regulator of adaptative response/methylated-DNA-[protein]-cysteine methyltransferase